MKIKVTMILAVLMLAGFGSVARADFKEGKWNMTMVTKMNSESPQMANAMKQMQNLPPQVLAMMKKKGISIGSNGEGMTITVGQCLTRQNPVPKSEHFNKHCTETHQFAGDTLSFTSSCNYNDTQMDSHGNFKFSGDSMSGQITAHGTAEGQPMDSTIAITGQYVGPC